MFVVALVSAVLASPTGGVFAGPTHASGCSGYWGAAVLGAEDKPQGIYVEGILYYFHAEYTRAAEDPMSGVTYPKVQFSSVAPDGCIAYVTDLPSRTLRLFAAGFSPSAAGARWPEDGPQRYQGTNGTILTYGFEAGLVWQATPWLWLAGGAGPLYENVKLAYAYDFGTFINSRLPPGSDLFAIEDPALEGSIDLAMSGWTYFGTLSAYAKPTTNLDLALSFFIAKNGQLSGTADVAGPAALREALPNLVINPQGRLELSYPIPWFLNFEAQWTVGEWKLAPMVQFQRRGATKALQARITESESNFIEGDQVSLREARDEVMLGLRVQRAMTDKLTVGVRFDVTPRNVPKEAISATNIDFTQIEGDLGMRYDFNPSWYIEATYAYIATIPVEVTRSIFNPRADPTSGLAQGSPLGRYTGFGQKLVVAFAYRFGS